MKDKNIQAIIQSAKQDRQVLAVGLFGSYARGEPYRDIDVCLFLKPGRYPPLALSRFRLHHTLPNGRYDVQIFQQLPPYIRKRILKDAKIIYCKDESPLYDLYFETIRKFDDYQKYYEDYLRAVLHGG